MRSSLLYVMATTTTTTKTSMEDKRFSPGFEYTFIELVRTRPLLYDKSLHDYRNRRRRSLKWTEILEILKSRGYNMKETKDIQSLEIKWRFLRDRFNRLHRDILSGKKLKFGEVRWPFYDSLLFLKNHHQLRVLTETSSPPRALSPPNPSTTIENKELDTTEIVKKFQLALIDLVKLQPMLYNPNHPLYKSSDTRKRTWKNIVDTLKSKGYDVSDRKLLENKWKNLMERFYRICRNIPGKMAAGPGTVVEVQWPFFGPLLFLKDYYQQQHNPLLPIRILTPPTPCTSTRDEEPLDNHEEEEKSDAVSVMDDNMLADDISIYSENSSISIHSETMESMRFSQETEKCPNRLAEIEEELLTFITNASSAITTIKEKGQAQQSNEVRTFSDFVASALQNMDTELMNTTMEAISEVIFSAKRQAQTYRSREKLT